MSWWEFWKPRTQQSDFTAAFLEQAAVSIPSIRVIDLCKFRIAITAIDNEPNKTTSIHNRLSGGARGTSHGTGFSYDTHVPILFYGWGVKHGTSSRLASITDIAPTLSMMLNIRLPNGSTGTPIFEITDK
jgi:hypothetical protein